MNGHPASSVSGVGVEDENRRVNVLAAVGVLAGALIMAIGLGLDVTSMGGLWPSRTADPTSRPSPIELRSAVQADELEARPSGPAALAARSAAARSAAEAPRAIDDPDAPAAPGPPEVILPPAAPPLPPADDVDPTVQQVADAIAAVLRPVVDLGATGLGI